MSDELKNTPDAEVNASQVEETPQEATINDVIEQVEEHKPEMVGLDKFLNEKKGRKAAEARIKELEALVQSGATRSEVSDDIDSIADEYGVDKTFLRTLTSTIEKKSQHELGAIKEKLSAYEQKERDERVQKAFDKGFNQALENMPEFKDVVNPEVIKTLSLDPKNGNKTFAQLIEETYGSALTGRRTVETTIPGGGKEPESVDFDRARSDTNYFKEVMANPALKKQYNEGLAQRLRL